MTQLLPQVREEGTVTLGDLTTRPHLGGSPDWILIQQTTHKRGVLISGQFEYGQDTDWMIKELDFVYL